MVHGNNGNGIDEEGHAAFPGLAQAGPAGQQRRRAQGPGEGAQGPGDRARESCNLHEALGGLGSPTKAYYFGAGVGLGKDPREDCHSPVRGMHADLIQFRNAVARSAPALC